MTDKHRRRARPAPHGAAPNRLLVLLAACGVVVAAVLAFSLG